MYNNVIIKYYKNSIRYEMKNDEKMNETENNITHHLRSSA